MRTRRPGVTGRVALLACLGAALTVLSACSGPTARLSRVSGVGPGLAGVGVLPPPASAWPASGYDARHSSSTPAVGPQQAQVRWWRDLGGNATPGPVIGADGSVLAATNNGVLHALDPRTGHERWTFDGGGGYGDDLSTSPAVVTGGLILWPGPRQRLFALSAAGRVLWSEAFTDEVLSPAVAGRGRVYVADRSGRLAALSVRGTAHRVVWRLELHDTDYASPTVGPDGTVYTGAGKDLVAIRDLGSRGAIRWRFHARKIVEVSNAVTAQGTVVLGTNGDREYGVGPDGAIRWQVDIGDYTYSSSVARHGRTYFGDNMGRLHVLDSADGSVLATHAPRGAGRDKIWSQVVVDAAGNYFWAGIEGEAYGYSASGHRLWRLQLGSGVDGYPAMGADGTLYLCTTGGRIVAIGA